MALIMLSGCAQKGVYEGDEAAERETRAEIEVLSESELSKLNNDAKGWGMRRRTPDPPEFTGEQIETMEKYGCIYKGEDGKKSLYLTFDEGYENGMTGKILDVLKEKNVKAVFFITGDYFLREKNLVDRMVAEGHDVGNHTMNHPSMPSLKSVKAIEEEVLKLDRAFYGRYKSHMKYLRPPKGEYSDLTLAVTKSMGYTNVFWSFAYDDWDTNKSRGADYAYQKTMENLHDGCVLLLHAVSKDNAEALGSIIDSAREEGYEFLPMESLIPSIDEKL